MDITPEQADALQIAREMAAAGIPIFLCAPNPEKPGKYIYKNDWQKSVADPSVVDQWQPGWALAAVGGHAADFLDMDPRSGGIESQIELKNAGQWPLSFGQQSTPSGGTHDILSRTGERKETGFMPGLDFQAGGTEPDATGSYGRAFVWIAPTVGVSKETGELVPYRWVHRPDLEALEEWRRPDGTSSDASTEGLIARVYSARARKAAPRASGAVAAFGAEASQFMQAGTAGHDGFTLLEAYAFVAPHYDALINSKIGDIEENGMAFTLALEHFVPAFWSVESAFGFVIEGLSHTAYDPNGPSDWTADKFLKRLDGRRPVLGSWKARRNLSAEEAAAVFGRQEGPAPVPGTPEEAQDAVDALLGRMLTAEQMMLQEPPEPLVWDLLDMDTQAALIGLPGSFKSFVALDIAAHVGGGRPWRGHQVHQGEVVYIVAEGARGMTLRTRAWKERNGAMPGVRFLPEPVQVKDPMAWQILIEACRRIKPVLVVVDTQAMVTVGIEENSNTEMGVAYAAFRKIREATGACVLLVHHTTKAGDTTRGAGSQDGAQDTRLKLERQQPRSSLIVKLKDEKQKDMAEGEDGGILLQMETVQLGVHPVTGRVLSSLVLGDASTFKLLADRGDDVEEWVRASISVREMVLQILRDHGEDRGITSAVGRRIVVERFFGGVKDRLKDSTWTTSWNRAVKDPSVIQVGGERFTRDPIAEIES